MDLTKYSFLDQDDREMMQRYLVNGSKTATHATKNVGTGWKVPKVDKKIFHAVTSVIVSSIRAERDVSE